MTIVRGLMLSVTLASIFAIFLVTILKVIKRAGFFHRKTAVVVSTAISILFLVALSQFLVGQGGADDTAGPNSGFLLPAVALGIAAAVLLSQVLLLANRMPPDEKPEPLAKKPDLAIVKSNSPGRPKKKEKPAEKPSKEAAKTTGEVAKKVESHS
jgi:hypothetical protein